MNHNKTSQRKFYWQWVAAALLTLLAFGSVAAATCEGLAALKLPNTTITSAQTVAAGAFTPPAGSAAPYKDVPAFCRVAGVIKPTSDSEIKFEVWLPSANWNGKFHGIGNGGFAGSISYGGMASAVARGFATASTDTPISAARARSTSMNSSGLLSCKSISGCTRPGFWFISATICWAVRAMFS